MLGGGGVGQSRDCDPNWPSVLSLASGGRHILSGVEYIQFFIFLFFYVIGLMPVIACVQNLPASKYCSLVNISTCYSQACQLQIEAKPVCLFTNQYNNPIKYINIDYQ